MLLGSRFRCLELVQHGLGGDVEGDLLQVGVGFGLDPHPVSDPRHQRDEPRDLVLGEQADLQVEVWLISTKVERKMASTEATIARMTNEESHAGTPGTQPRLATNQKPKMARCR
jgi:hypothetical protein